MKHHEHRAACFGSDAVQPSAVPAARLRLLRRAQLCSRSAFPGTPARRGQTALTAPNAGEWPTSFRARSHPALQRLHRAHTCGVRARRCCIRRPFYATGSVLEPECAETRFLNLPASSRWGGLHRKAPTASAASRRCVSLGTGLPSLVSRGHSIRQLGPVYGVRIRSSRGPATAEIDAPHLRGRRRLNRRVNLILSRALPLTAVRGNSLGIDVGIKRESGLGPGPLRSIASGGDRPSFGPVPVT